MQGSSTITNCKAGKGGGVHVSGGTFKMQDSAVVTPATGSEQYTAGKNDVYLESGKTITVNGSLSHAHAARITVPNTAYNTSTQVLAGTIIGGSPQNYTKFTVTPQKVTENSENWNVFWYIAADGTLKAEVEDSSLLQEVIRSRPGNTPFIIKLGNIDDLQTVEIPGNKKIMLKADRDVTLTCPNNGHDHYKHLQVQRDATLILEGKIKLQGADYGDKDHYALYVEDGGKAEIKDGVTITGFKNTGRGTVFVDGNLTMSGGTITGNKAGNKGDGSAYDDGKGGGSVYVGATGKFIMKGGTITQNKASGYNTFNGGGGVYVDGSYNGGDPIRGQFTMEGGTIEENEAYAGGGVLVIGTFTMTGGKITKNKSDKGKGVMVRGSGGSGATFDWQDGEITTNYGFGAAVVTEGGTFNDHGHTAD